MKIYGYGEDGLTVWGLIAKWDVVIRGSVRDGEAFEEVNSDQIAVYFRPSFGRSGGESSAEFGEFDAILTTPERILLIESKWDNCRKPSSKKRSRPLRIRLRDEQVDRHRILKKLLDCWKQCDSWDQFSRVKPKEAGLHRPLPVEGRLLWRNLRHIVPQIMPKPCQRTVVDVLLYFHLKGTPSPTIEVVDTQNELLKCFRPVCLEYETISQSGYFELKIQTREHAP